jgi:hypothetical protein
MKGAPNTPNVLTGKKSQKNDGSHNWEAGEKISGQPDDSPALLPPFAGGLSKYYLGDVVRKTLSA